ncbi:hypothetical protein A8B78_10470 [Jannaschia sp. EhC01]|nr:hypothetical protein A8B78_10470 [Jannaschia sp. EhC01]
MHVFCFCDASQAEPRSKCFVLVSPEVKDVASNDLRTGGLISPRACSGAVPRHAQDLIVPVSRINWSRYTTRAMEFAVKFQQKGVRTGVARINLLSKR